MTEFEKKQNGEVYDSRNPQLRNQQNKAKNLMKEFNNLPAEELTQRNRALSSLFGQFGKNARVNQPIYVDYGYNIFLDDNSFINMHCTLLDTAPIIIGKNTLIGPDVKIYTATHALDAAQRFCLNSDGTASIRTQAKPVKIGSFTWIGGGSIILPGVTIGSNVIIGAGSVITESIPDNAIACGNPCRIKKWNPPLTESS